MEPLELKQDIAKRLLVARIAWAGMLFSTIIYISIGFALPVMGSFKPPADPPPEMVIWILMAFGLMDAAAGVLVGTGKLPFPKISRGEDVGAALSKRFSGFVIGWALCESAAIFGLVAFFLSGAGGFDKLATMCAVAALGMIASFPTESKFMDAAREAGMESYNC